MHELCESRSRAGLVRPLYSDHAWVAANFEQAFPPETPLNRGRFYEARQSASSGSAPAVLTRVHFRSPHRDDEK